MCQKQESSPVNPRRWIALKRFQSARPVPETADCPKKHCCGRLNWLIKPYKGCFHRKPRGGYINQLYPSKNKSIYKLIFKPFLKEGVQI